MARLLPAGLVDPSVVPDPSSPPVNFARAWDFHFDIYCCGSPGYAHFSLSGGKPVLLSGEDSVLQWVRSALAIARNKYRAYGSRFGSDFERIIGERGPAVETRAEQMVIDSLQADPRISRVSADATVSPSYGMHIKVVVNTVDGGVFALDDVILED